MPKCRRAIVLDKKMREPCERIRNHDHGQHQPRPAQNNRGGQQTPSAQGSNRVKNPRGQLLVRQHIETPKLRRRLRLAHVRDCSSRAPPFKRKKNTTSLSFQRGSAPTHCCLTRQEPRNLPSRTTNSIAPP